MPVEDAMPMADAELNTRPLDKTADFLIVETKMRSLGATIEALKAAYARQSEQLVGAQRLTEALRAQVDALSTANIALQTQLSEKNARIAALEEELGALTAAKTDLEAALTAKDNAALELEARVAHLQAELSTAGAEAETLRIQVAELQAQLSEASQARRGLEAQLAEGAQTRAALEEQLRSAQESAGSLADQLEALNAELTTTQQQLAETSQTKAELEQRLAAAQQAQEELQMQLAAAQEAQAALQAQVEEISQAKSDLEGQLAARTVELGDLRSHMEQLDERLAAFSAALDGEDETAVTEAAQQLAIFGATTGALVAATQRRYATLRQNETELTELRAQMQSLIDGKAELAASLAAQSAEIERLNRELAARTQAQDELEAQLATRNDEVIALQHRIEELQERLQQTTEETERTRTELQMRRAEIERLQNELADAVGWQQRAPAMAEFGRSLSLMGENKLVAANSAVAMRLMPRTVRAPQDLALVKGIGRVYEQRLYEAGIGTYWELANLSNEEMERILQVNPLQMLSIDFDAIRADAERLAQETNTVGQLWSGEAPDDFEPIEGIGRIYEQRLYEAGIRTYRELASTTPERLAEIIKPRPPARPDFARWIAEAQRLAEAARQ